MAILEILTMPDERLRKKAAIIEQITDKHRQMLDDMLETMYEEGGVGLAATQVNIHERMFVMDVSTARNEPVKLINPEIIAFEGELDMEEGCLSVPGIYAKVTRPQKLTVKYLNENGETQETTLEGYSAKCIHHEIDHLNGVVFIDHLSPLKRKMLEGKLKKLVKAKQHPK
jgi:peptide deformylase